MKKVITTDMSEAMSLFNQLDQLTQKIVGKAHEISNCNCEFMGQCLDVNNIEIVGTLLQLAPLELWHRKWRSMGMNYLYQQESMDEMLKRLEQIRGESK